jgi:hypothetical protein
LIESLTVRDSITFVLSFNSILNIVNEGMGAILFDDRHYF